MNIIVGNKMIIKIGIIIFIFIIGLFLEGCMGTYNIHESGKREAICSLAGGVVGALVAGNTGGAIVGALVANVYSASTIKYEDKKIENGEEAARRLKQNYEKAEDSKGLDKKAEDSKGLDKKAEDSKGLDKKAEERSGRQQKAEKKRIEERVKLFIEESQLADRIVRAGSPVESNIRYTILAGKDGEGITLIETRILIAANKSVELDSREVHRTQGTYLTTVKFTLPDDIPEGYCVLSTTISNGKSARTSKAVMKII